MLLQRGREGEPHGPSGQPGAGQRRRAGGLREKRLSAQGQAGHGSQAPRSVLSRERLWVLRGDAGLGGLLRLELLDAVECLGESESWGPKGDISGAQGRGAQVARPRHPAWWLFRRDKAPLSRPRPRAPCTPRPSRTSTQREAAPPGAAAAQPALPAPEGAAAPGSGAPARLQTGPPAPLTSPS